MKLQPILSIAILSLPSIAPDAIAASKPKNEPYGGNPCPIVGPGYPICPPPKPPKVRKMTEQARVHVPTTPIGCRNVNDDVKECPDRRQGNPKPKGYLWELALKTLPPEPKESPRPIKIKIAGLPKDASSEKDKKKSDKAYRGSGRFAADSGQYS